MRGLLEKKGSVRGPISDNRNLPSDREAVESLPFAEAKKPATAGKYGRAGKSRDGIATTIRTAL
jgi:hypothetical protein